MLLHHETSLIQSSYSLPLAYSPSSATYLNSKELSSFSYHILTLPSIPPVTNLFGTIESAFSLIAGFIISLFSAMSKHGSVAGPQLSPLTLASCA